MKLTREQQREYSLKEARRIGRDCRKEMRSWALWWRRGSRGATPKGVLIGAKLMRDRALAMERQAAEILKEVA